MPIPGRAGKNFSAQPAHPTIQTIGTDLFNDSYFNEMIEIIQQYPDLWVEISDIPDNITHETSDNEIAQMLALVLCIIEHCPSVKIRINTANPYIICAEKHNNMTCVLCITTCLRPWPHDSMTTPPHHPTNAMTLRFTHPPSYDNTTSIHHDIMTPWHHDSTTPTPHNIATPYTPITSQLITIIFFMYIVCACMCMCHVG